MLYILLKKKILFLGRREQSVQLRSNVSRLEVLGAGLVLEI